MEKAKEQLQSVVYKQRTVLTNQAAELKLPFAAAIKQLAAAFELAKQVASATAKEREGRLPRKSSSASAREGADVVSRRCCATLPREQSAALQAAEKKAEKEKKSSATGSGS